ncbi:MAG TPA: hypothetical protein VNI77_00745 [Nitrososphaera sp.]|nr:hypothetical protein [Nitrososphaera sp.]
MMGSNLRKSMMHSVRIQQPAHIDDLEASGDLNYVVTCAAGSNQLLAYIPERQW